MAIISKWLFNGNVNDSAGSNNGTATNITYSDGKFGQSATGNEHGVAIPTTTMGTIGTGDFSISFWINPVNPGSTRHPMLFGSFRNTSPFQGPTIFFDPLNTGGGAGGDGIAFRCASGNVLGITSPSASSLYNKWTHIVFTRGSGTMNVYYDGVLVGSLADTTNIAAAEGAFIVGRPPSSVQRFGNAGAKFDQAEVHNTALSPAEIKNKYLEGVGFFTT